MFSISTVFIVCAVVFAMLLNQKRGKDAQCEEERKESNQPSENDNPAAVSVEEENSGL